MRNVLLLLTGLIVGIAGAFLIRGSIPPEGGTPEARILELENELRETRLRLAKIDPSQARPREDVSGSIREGIRDALDDFKSGRPVDLNRAYQALKPLMRELVPIFDRIRRRDERRAAEHLAGHLSRQYHLNGTQQEALKEWIQARRESNSKAFMDLATAKNTRIDDLAKASRRNRMDDGLDEFMETQLKGEELDKFRKDRLTERADRVQHEADWKVERLNSTVDLDEAQKDQVFSIMARSSQDFDPKMQIEGVTADAATPSAEDRDAAVMAVLRPDQQTKYNQWKEERRARTEQEMAEMGLKMPEGWDALGAD
ncbi:MAG TPA: hypothetical protein VG796_05665 [Verrucomicrobiales bacterium]|nr:hypothetical protein [Verrucomicrobiales bacterium]